METAAGTYSSAMWCSFLSEARFQLAGYRMARPSRCDGKKKKTCPVWSTLHPITAGASTPHLFCLPRRKASRCQSSLLSQPNIISIPLRAKVKRVLAYSISSNNFDAPLLENKTVNYVYSSGYQGIEAKFLLSHTSFSDATIANSNTVCDCILHHS